jgi:hypothetical protein
VQELLPLWGQHFREDVEPRHVAGRTAEVGDKSKVDWISAGYEYDRNGCGCRLSGERRRWAERGDDSDLALNQIRGRTSTRLNSGDGGHTPP